MKDLKRSAERYIDDIESAANDLRYTIDEMKDKAEEDSELSVEKVIEWLDSPYVSDFDKNAIKNHIQAKL